MRPSHPRTAIAAILLSCTAAAWAKPDALTAELSARLAPVLNNMPVEKVTPTTHAGLYEVLTPGGIIYTDKAGSFIVFGTMVDTATKTNLTKKRLDELSTFEFKELPLQDAIKTVKGDGSRVLATFEDPNCGYCKKLMQEFSKLDNVTIYTFLVPILGPDSTAKSTAIWCSENRAKAWTGFMSGTAAAPAQPTNSCNTPFARNETLRQKLRINGTPAILFKDNTKESGLIPATAIEARLKK